MAEREGFEPSVEFPLHTLSKRAPSTTRTSLRSSGMGILAHVPRAMCDGATCLTCDVRTCRVRTCDVRAVVSMAGKPVARKHVVRKLCT